MRCSRSLATRARILWMDAFAPPFHRRRFRLRPAYRPKSVSRASPPDHAQVYEIQGPRSHPSWRLRRDDSLFARHERLAPIITSLMNIRYRPRIHSRIEPSALRMGFGAHMRSSGNSPCLVSLRSTTSSGSPLAQRLLPGFGGMRDVIGMDDGAPPPRIECVFGDGAGIGDLGKLALRASGPDHGRARLDQGAITSSLSRRRSSALLRSWISLAVPTHSRTEPSGFSKGTPRVNIQRYSPSR